MCIFGARPFDQQVVKLNCQEATLWYILWFFTEVASGSENEGLQLVLRGHKVLTHLLTLALCAFLQDYPPHRGVTKTLGVQTPDLAFPVFVASAA